MTANSSAVTNNIQVVYMISQGYLGVLTYKSQCHCFSLFLCYVFTQKSLKNIRNAAHMRRVNVIGEQCTLGIPPLSTGRLDSMSAML